MDWSGGGLDTAAEARNIYLSVSYCQQTLRVNPERLFLIGEASALALSDALALPVASAIKPEGLDVSNEVFIKFAVPLSALYTQKSMDISPQSLRHENLTNSALGYGTAVFCALGLILIIFLAFTVDKTSATSDRLAMQTNRLAHTTRTQSAYIKAYDAYKQYRPFLEQAGKRPFSRFFTNLSAMDLPGVAIERLSASNAGDGFIVKITGLIEARTLVDTEARYRGLLEYIKGPGAMTVEEKRLMIGDNSFEISARHR